jgi:hypothetical protein
VSELRGVSVYGILTGSVIHRARVRAATNACLFAASMCRTAPPARAPSHVPVTHVPVAHITVAHIAVAHVSIAHVAVAVLREGKTAETEGERQDQSKYFLHTAPPLLVRISVKREPFMQNQLKSQYSYAGKMKLR